MAVLVWPPLTRSLLHPVQTQQMLVLRTAHRQLERARMCGEDAASTRAALEAQVLSLKTENATLRRFNQNFKAQQRAAARADAAAAAASKAEERSEDEDDGF
jgi:hypothetical protein